MPGSNSSSPSAAGAGARAAVDEPLGLTVHSMPSARQSLEADDGKRTRRGRWKMLAVMAVCAAPVVASYFTYYVVRPHGQAGYGELLQPLRPLPAASATDTAGAPADLRSLKGQWLLLSVSGAACDAVCERQLYLVRQLRESLGRDKARVDRVWLLDDAAPVPGRLASGVAGATVLRVPPATLAAWLPPADGHQRAEHIFVVDPLGNLMMRFPASMDTAGAASAKRDLDRLLRASASWDEEGRP